MKKIKVFFLASALVLTTVGVFAGMNKFSGGGFYAYNSAISSTYYPLTNSTATLGELELLASGDQALINDATNNSFGIYYYNGSTFEKLQSTTAW